MRAKSSAAPGTSRGERDDQSRQGSQHPEHNPGLFGPATRESKRDVARYLVKHPRWQWTCEIVEEDGSSRTVAIPRRGKLPDFDGPDAAVVLWAMLRNEVAERWPGAALELYAPDGVFVLLVSLKIGGETEAVAPVGVGDVLGVVVASALTKVWRHGLPNIGEAVSVSSAVQRGEVGDA